MSKNKILASFLVFSIFLILSLSLSSSLIISSISFDKVSPGGESRGTIIIKNNLGQDVESVTLSLDLSNLPFTAVGSSEDSIDEIRDDKREEFIFIIKAANDIKAGDYEIPYTLSYSNESGVKQQDKKGTFGITVSADTKLDYSVSTENPIINQQGKINFKIINKGFADAKFVSLTLFPDGYTLLSEEKSYIGTISSDDFDTTSFDVIFKNEHSSLIAVVEYLDFNNIQRKETINLPITVYTKDKAVELGILKSSNIPLYIGVVILIILVWFVWRMVAKRRKRKSMQTQGV